MTHPGDKWLAEAITNFARFYSDVDANIAKALESYAKKRGWEATGRTWRKLRKALAEALSDANEDALEQVNAVSPEAFAEGANQANYVLMTRGGGAGRKGRGYEPAPYTPSTVIELALDGLLELAIKEVNRQKDIRYNEKVIQAVVNAALIDKKAQGGGGCTRGGGARRFRRSVKKDKQETDTPAEIRQAAREISHKIVNHVQKATTTTAQAVVFSSYDGGMYQAGIDASGDGFEIEKTWLGIPDARIRDSHRHLHMTTIPIMELFHGFHGVLRYPHDPAAPPAETYNCRCRLAIHMAGEHPEAPTVVLPSDTGAYKKWRDKAIRSAGTKLTEMHRRRLYDNIRR